MVSVAELDDRPPHNLARRSRISRLSTPHSHRGRLRVGAHQHNIAFVRNEPAHRVQCRNIDAGTSGRSGSHAFHVPDRHTKLNTLLSKQINESWSTSGGPASSPQRRLSRSRALRPDARPPAASRVAWRAARGHRAGHRSAARAGPPATRRSTRGRSRSWSNR